MKKNRRNLLKTLSVAGSTAVVWTTPVVHSVILPAHAGTTGSTETGCALTCSPSPSSVTTTVLEGDQECFTDIQIIFDGQNCSIANYDNASSCGGSGGPSANAMFAVDANDGDTTHFDIYGSGANWTVTNYNGMNPDTTDNAGANGSPPRTAGQYTLRVEGTCGVYDLTFTVTLVPGNIAESVRMTVNGVSISAVT